MKFINRSKFNSLIVRANNEDESKVFQNLLFRYGFSWPVDDTEFFVINQYDNEYNCMYIYADFRYMKLLFSCDYLDRNYIKGDNLVYDKVYDISLLHELKIFLKNGQNKPSYNSKKISK